MKGLENDIPGFQDVEGNEDADDNEEIRKPKNSKRGGGFQSMGLSYNILKGIIRRGYKIPTPIQRKTIPLVMEGHDVVAMARTGSGKTACFLIPMFEKLKHRAAKTGARALILSPTRELALQTLKFLKDIGRFTDLKAAVILGGDSMNDQFSALHGNPDMIVATPGRFLHVCVEMDLKLNNIEYVVFDEADRLFEMGLGEQLTEIIARLPDSRQTVLFSATLPKVLVEFAKAGLSDPTLIRLDVESKLPTELELFYINVRQDEKLAALLVLLKTCVENDQKTVIFAATKHHVDYLHTVLNHMGIENTYIYSDLDPSARKIHTAKFSNGRVKFLVVTDVAARGIDIPCLDNVINYNFPAKPKLFVHRVGRSARAGRSGKAYSLVTPDEYAHLLDLHLFLGTSLSICTSKNKDGNFGRMPQSLIEEQQSILNTLHLTHNDLVNLKGVSDKGFQQYMRSRQTASTDSNKRVKNLPFQNCFLHPLFLKEEKSLEGQKQSFLDEMKSYRPHGTIFEICGKTKSQEYVTMKERRSLHKDKIAEHRINKEQIWSASAILENKMDLTGSNEKDIKDTFQNVILPKKRRIEDLYRRDNKRTRLNDNYIPYNSADRFTEVGLAVNNFQNEAMREEFDLIGDSSQTMNHAKQLKKWDRKKKKMVGVKNVRAGKIKTESGVWISASYKSDRYKHWKEKTKSDQNDIDFETEDTDNKRSNDEGLLKGPKKHWEKHNEKLKQKERSSELKSAEDILKARRIAAKKKRANMKKGKKGRRKRKQR